MASSVIPQAQVKKKTVTLTTNTVGRVVGSTQDLIGVANATILSAYFEKGSYGNTRRCNVYMYGSSGYAIEFMDGTNPVASASVSATVTYIE